jgi:hypothetical protein
MSVFGGLAVDIPVIYPHPADVIAEEVERFRRLSIAERLEHLARLVASGRSFSKSGSNEIGRQNDEDRLEAEWQQAHREVFERYGR